MVKSAHQKAMWNNGNGPTMSGGRWLAYWVGIPVGLFVLMAIFA